MEPDVRSESPGIWDGSKVRDFGMFRVQGAPFRKVSQENSSYSIVAKESWAALMS